MLSVPRQYVSTLGVQEWLPPMSHLYSVFTTEEYEYLPDRLGACLACSTSTVTSTTLGDSIR